MLYIGIDLGTSACKLLLVDGTGQVQNTVTKEYPLSFPRPGWSEQDPAHWRQAVLEGVPELLTGFDAAQVKGIGCGGQMHGLVALDRTDAVLRPAILWNDGRTAKEVDYLNGIIGREKLSQYTGPRTIWSIVSPAFMPRITPTLPECCSWMWRGNAGRRKCAASAGLRKNSFRNSAKAGSRWGRCCRTLPGLWACRRP